MASLDSENERAPQSLVKTRSSPLKPKRETLLKKITEHQDYEYEESTESAETPYPKNSPKNLTGAANSSIQQESAENSDMMESKMLIQELQSRTISRVPSQNQLREEQNETSAEHSKEQQ